MMKRRVKNRDLNNSFQKMIDNLHTFEFGAIVKRREFRNAGNRMLHDVVDENRFFKARAPVDDPMAHDANFGRFFDGPGVTLEQ